MDASGQREKGNGRRKSILDLAPLELHCMNTLWPMGEGTVREIRDQLASIRPRAYTTIMTIMDRLAQKGVVTRRKVGRAYLYRPSVTAQEARAHAVQQLVESFFGGSAEALLAHLSGGAPLPAGPSQPEPANPAHRVATHRAGAERIEKTQLAETAENLPAAPIDETLL